MNNVSIHNVDKRIIDALVTATHEVNNKDIIKFDVFDDDGFRTITLTVDGMTVTLFD